VPDTALVVWVVEPSQLFCEVAPVLHSSTLKPVLWVSTVLAPSEIVTTAASPSYWPAELYWGVVWYGPELTTEPVGKVVTWAEAVPAKALRPETVKAAPSARREMLLIIFKTCSFWVHQHTPASVEIACLNIAALSHLMSSPYRSEHIRNWGTTLERAIGQVFASCLPASLHPEHLCANGAA
jgi:hypothetical protein